MDTPSDAEPSPAPPEDEAGVDATAQQRVEDLRDAYGLGDAAALAVVALAMICGEIADVVLPQEDDEPEDADGSGAAGPSVEETVEQLQEVAATVLATPPGDPDGTADPGEGLDADTVLLLLAELADPDAAEALLSEVERVERLPLAVLGAFATSIESRAPRAARPALAWSRGRAHEALGAVLDAELAYEDALALDPEWPPALHDLARMASDRGDTARGLSLLRRAGAHDDDRLVGLLRRFTVTDRRDVGRNDPCWCGSGRKYKVCHRGQESLTLAQRLPWLRAKADHHLDYVDGGDLVTALAEWWSGADEAVPGADVEDDVHAAAADPLLRDVALVEGGGWARFLDDRGALLPPDERELADTVVEAPRVAYEVVALGRGAGTLREAGASGGAHDPGSDGDDDERPPRELAPGALASFGALRAGDVVLTRLVALDDGWHPVSPVEVVDPDAVTGLRTALAEDPDPYEALAAILAAGPDRA